MSARMPQRGKRAGRGEGQEEWHRLCACPAARLYLCARVHFVLARTMGVPCRCCLLACRVCWLAPRVCLAAAATLSSPGLLYARGQRYLS